MTQFPKLFDPGNIGRLQLKNRIIMPPMVARYTTADGLVSEQQVDYYAERARGGCGLIVVEASYPRSGGYPGRIYLDDDRVIPGLRRLVEAIHTGGARAGIQINPHRGRSDEVDPASPSKAIHPKTGVRARALSVTDVEKLVDSMGEGARRVKEAGFECIMIHGASGYLISEFLSPRINRRNDAYGGNTEKRARFVLEIVTAIKAKAGTDYPVIFRMTADERVEGGFGLKDAIVVARLLEEAGVDAIDVISGVIVETFAWVNSYMYMPRGYNTHLSQAIKKEVKIPVSVAGRINDPYLAEDILRGGKADFIDLGRALISDPQFVNKAKAGQVADICKCIACCRCYESILKPPVGPMVCAVNPAVGSEKEFESRLRPVTKRKKVLVIGGGPGGMESAIIAAQRGHDVTLWERSNGLGNQLRLASVPPGKEEIKGLLEYLEHQLGKLKVTIKLRQNATPEAVLAFSPDVVILAVGSKVSIPEIKGAERKKLVVFNDALSGRAKLGKKVIVIGGGFVGCETADFLAEKGKKVTVIEILPELASELWSPYADLLIQKLKDKEVEVFTEVKGEEVTNKGMEIIEKDGKRISLEADDIVIATGLVSDKTLFESLRDKVPELYEVGDCVKVRRIHEAILEGAQAALRI